MEKIGGIGGLFFRVKDPSKLARWYRDHLGMPLVPASHNERPWVQTSGPTILAPFPEDTTSFGSLACHWVVNFRVPNLDAMVAQLQAKGIAVEN